MEREAGSGIRMGNTCKSMADSCQCMAKITKICKVISFQLIKVNGLFLARKVMTNLDSILKNRDVTLPTNFHVVKAMVFPVFVYGCESWIIKKAEC